MSTKSKTIQQAAIGFTLKSVSGDALTSTDQIIHCSKTTDTSGTTLDEVLTNIENQLKGATSTFTPTIVTALPTSDIKTDVLYILKTTNADNTVTYVQYIYSGTEWVNLGGLSVDLSDYIKSSDLVAVTDADITALDEDVED